MSFKTKNKTNLELEEIFESYLEKTGCGLSLYYVENQYMLIDFSGECVSRRYKKVSSLMSWFNKNMGDAL